MEISSISITSMRQRIRPSFSCFTVSKARFGLIISRACSLKPDGAAGELRCSFSDHAVASSTSSSAPTIRAKRATSPLFLATFKHHFRTSHSSLQAYRLVEMCFLNIWASRDPDYLRE